METRTHVLSDPERFHGRDSSRRAIRSNASESDISLPVYHLTGWSPGPDGGRRSHAGTASRPPQKELQEIKSLLRARPTAAAPAQEAVVSVDGAPFKGKKDARVTLVDFTDYQ
jgi:hypothetical protein